MSQQECKIWSACHCRSVRLQHWKFYICHLSLLQLVAMERYTKEQCVIVKTHYKYGKSYAETVLKICGILGPWNAPQQSTVQRMIKKFEETGSIMDSSTVQEILIKNLDLHAYKIQLTQELKPTDHCCEKNFLTVSSHEMVIRIGHRGRAIWHRATSFFGDLWNLVSMPKNHKQFLSSRRRFDALLAELSCNYAEMSSRISSKEQECASRVVGDICQIVCSTSNCSVCTLYWNKNISTFWINCAFYYKIKSCALVGTPFTYPLSKSVIQIHSLISQNFQEGCIPDAIMDKPNLCCTQSCQTSSKTHPRQICRRTLHILTLQNKWVHVSNEFRPYECVCLTNSDDMHIHDTVLTTNHCIPLMPDGNNIFKTCKQEWMCKHETTTMSIVDGSHLLVTAI